MSSLSNRVEAVICYGWESREFYAKWVGDNDPEIIKQMQGPTLNIGHQSKLAPAILEIVKNIIRSDQRYVKRLKRHYKMFKAHIDKNGAVGMEDKRRIEISRSGSQRKLISRNAPCPCGSGKKRKRCCGKNG